MRPLSLAALVALSLALPAGSSAQSVAATELPSTGYSPLESLPPALRSIAETARDDWFGVPPDEGEERRAAETAAAVIDGPGDHDFVIVQLPSSGNCGDWHQVFSPALPGQRLLYACGVGIWAEDYPGSDWPDLLAATGRFAAWRKVWNGETYERGRLVATLPPAEPTMALGAADGRDRLRRLEGSRDYAPLFVIPEVRQRLEAGFGDSFPRFLYHFEMTDQLAADDGYLSGRAALRHSYGSYESFLAIGLEAGDVHAGLFVRDDETDSATLTIVSDAGRLEDLPPRLRAWAEHLGGGTPSAFRPETLRLVWVAGRPCPDGLAPSVTCDR